MVNLNGHVEQCQIVGESNSLVGAIDNLPANLRAEILSRAWAEMAAVVNEGSVSGAEKLISSGDFNKDWQNLQSAVWKLVETERARVLEAFYNAVIIVLKQYKEERTSSCL